MAWRYSVAIDVLGAVMERAIAKSLPEIVAERVTRPVGMHDTSFTATDVSRLAVPYVDATPRPKRMSDEEVVPVRTPRGRASSLSRHGPLTRRRSRPVVEKAK